MSTPADLPRNVVTFLRTHVDHSIKLRFLLALHSAPSGATSLSLFARAVDVPKNQIRDMAHELAADVLVRVSHEQIELAPMAIEDRLAIADLVDWYRRDRDTVMGALRALGRA
jgi:hypothetical protein